MQKKMAIIQLCIFVSSFWVLSTMCLAAKSDDSLGDEGGEGALTISLTSFNITETNLEMSWRIKNNTHHNVWICHSITPNPERSDLEHFLDSDARTLVLRKRFDLPMQEDRLKRFPPLTSRYNALRPGQEKKEYLFLPLPVRHRRISAGESGVAEEAERLILEIGYYDEDLPELILHIIEVNELLHCDTRSYIPDPNELRSVDRFFRGAEIARIMNDSVAYLDEIVNSDGDSMVFPYSGQLNSEKTLRITVEGVSIPYKAKL